MRSSANGPIISRRPSNARTFAFILVGLILAAIVASAAWSGLIQWRLERDEEYAVLFDQAYAASRTYESTFESTANLLDSLAEFPEIQDPQQCNQTLNALAEGLNWIANLGLIDPQGLLRCSAVPVARPIDLTHRTYFRQAIESEAPSVGELQIGLVTGIASINLGHPVTAPDGTPAGVLFAAIDLASIEVGPTDLRFQPEAKVFVIGASGGLLGGNPPATSTPAGFDLGGLSDRLAPESAGVTVSNIDGTPHVIGYVEVPNSKGVTALAVRPLAAAHGEANAALARHFLPVLVGASLLGTTTWLVTERYLARPLHRIDDTVKRLEDGDLSARCGQLRPNWELTRAAGAVDRMADRVERRITAESDARAKLSATMVERDRLYAMVAHDLGNPLSVLNMQLDLIREAHSEEEFMAGFAMLQRNVIRIQRLVRDLTLVSRLEGGSLRLETEPTDLAVLATNTVQLLAARAANENIALHLAIERSLPLSADPGRIEQVLSNLIGNALKFTPPGGEVSVSVYQHGEEGRVCVRDTGSGLSPSDLDRIFQPFVQAANAAAARERGTGLGLFISKGLMKAHGGTIEARSGGLGKGCEFTITIPLGSNEDHPDTTDPAPA